jgi:uncharacterized protein with HEPN domain
MRRPEGVERRRDPRAYLLDMQRAIALLRTAAGAKTLAEYAGDAILRSAVERQFITIGEALTQLLRLMPDLQARISNTRRIIAFRNILVHGYAEVAHDIVWSALQDDLLVLGEEVNALLCEMRDNDR